MTKIKVPQEIHEEISSQSAQRNGDKRRSREKRLDGNLDAVTRNLHQVLSVAKKREDYGLALETVDRLLEVARIEQRRLEGAGHAS